MLVNHMYANTVEGEREPTDFRFLVVGGFKNELAVCVEIHDGYSMRYSDGVSSCHKVC